MRNSQTDRWHGNETALHEVLDEEKALADAAEASGDWSGTAVWAGESVDLVHEVLPAAEIVERTVSEAVAILSGGSNHTLVGTA